MGDAGRKKQVCCGLDKGSSVKSSFAPSEAELFSPNGKLNMIKGYLLKGTSS